MDVSHVHLCLLFLLRSEESFLLITQTLCAESDQLLRVFFDPLLTVARALWKVERQKKKDTKWHQKKSKGIIKWIAMTTA